MPSHTHRVYLWYGQSGFGTTIPAYSHYLSKSSGAVGYTSSDMSDNNIADVYNTGGSQSHNNLQPYITVYMWKRTA